MSIEYLADWLKSYGVEEFDGLVALLYKDVIDVTVEASGDGGALFLSANLGNLSKPDDPDVLRHFLLANHKGEGTRGACLSLDPSGECAVLWQSWPLDALSAEAFDRLFGVFLDTAEEQRLVLGLDGGETPADDDARSEPNRLSNFSLRV